MDMVGDDEDIASPGAFDHFMCGMDMGFIGSLAPERDDCIAQLLLQQLGAGRRHIREQRQADNRRVSKIN